MKKNEVTIGVCVRNCESTIKESLCSILSQDFPHEMLKIIVVDGNSKDRTMPIVKDFLSRTDIQFLILSDNGKGLGKARSMVVDNASGKYIVWVDGDVVLPSNYISEQIKFMEQNGKVGIVEGKFGIYKGKNLCALLESLSCNADAKTNVGMKAVPAIVAAAGSSFRLDALKQVGNFDSNIKGAGEDVEIAFRIKSAGWLLAINQEVLHRNRERWKDLWEEYFWWGYGGHYVSRKFPRSLLLWREFPPVALAFGILHAFRAFKITHLKACFLLPLHHVFTATAWFTGFVKSHIDGYDPRHLSIGMIQQR